MTLTSLIDKSWMQPRMAWPLRHRNLCHFLTSVPSSRPLVTLDLSVAWVILPMSRLNHSFLCIAPSVPFISPAPPYCSSLACPRWLCMAASWPPLDPFWSYCYHCQTGWRSQPTLAVGLNLAHCLFGAICLWVTSWFFQVLTAVLNSGQTRV